MDLDKILGPYMVLAKEFPSPNQSVARIISNIPALNPLHFSTWKSTSNCMYSWYIATGTGIILIHSLVPRPYLGTVIFFSDTAIAPPGPLGAVAMHAYNMPSKSSKLHKWHSHHCLVLNDTDFSPDGPAYELYSMHS